MRMRKKKHGSERLAARADIVASKPEVPKKSAKEIFGKDMPLYLEIGCGKGDFACGMSAKYPDVGFFAFEKIADVVVCAAEKAQERKSERKTDNLRFAVGDANDITSWFAKDSVDALYLNFSDPWPKKKHEKRRLTSKGFLKLYFDVMKDGARLTFKTDNLPLFYFTLSELNDLNIVPDILTFDLHHSVYDEENIETEYERNFSSKGFAINMLSFTLKK